MRKPSIVGILLICTLWMGARSSWTEEPHPLVRPRASPLGSVVGEREPLVSTPSARDDVSALPPLVLPRYQMVVHLDTARARVRAQQEVTWTNPGPAATERLLFHVYPRHRPNKEQLRVYERTVESLRLEPRESVDRQGRRLQVTKASAGATDLQVRFDPELDTVMWVQLPAPVAPGESVRVHLEFELQLPHVQGRAVQYLGVTSLANWYPILGYYGSEGWDPTPFVGWHQPFHNEAGHYQITLTAPAGETIACSGQIVERTQDGAGRQTLELMGDGIRDFTIVSSKRYEVHEAVADGIPVRVVAFPEHRYYAKVVLESATAALTLYNRWFGRYAYPSLTIAESYFGWNGNETTGLILLDYRVFDAPQLGHQYVRHLVFHEVCHQWWYAAVGNDGYRETWLDEALASYFTQRAISAEIGREGKILDWNKAVSWLPNISYESFLHDGYYLYRGRGGKATTVAPLPKIGHIYALFFVTYSRGNKVVSMLHQRMGDERFFAFFRHLYTKYRFRVLHLREFQREVEEFTGQDWTAFFSDWLHSTKIADWRVDNVHVENTPAGYRSTVTVRQVASIDEPVEIGWRSKGEEALGGRVFLDPRVSESQGDGWFIKKTSVHDWQVVFYSPKAPGQVVIDPDHRILDANLQNNLWKVEIPIRFTPFFNPLDEAPIFHPLDQPSVAWGPGIDQEGRPTLRGVLLRGNRYRVSPYLAYTPEIRDNQWVAGIQGEIFNVPAPNFSLGLRYERTLSTQLFDDPGDQGRVFMRWYQAYTSSLVFPYHLAYVETYFRFGDNFFPDEDLRQPQRPGVESYRDVRAFGISYHLDTQLPYWNPEQGIRFDGGYEYGFRAFGDGDTYHRLWGQLSTVYRLPGGMGWLSDTRVAGRIAGGIGSPDNGEHFRFGGPQRFRGQRSEDTEGNSFWLASTDWRFPLAENLDWPLFDNVFNGQAIYGVTFYDVGETYLNGGSLGVDHAVGAGLHFQFALASFVERLTLRVEYGHSLRYGYDIAWFGLFQAF